MRQVAGALIAILLFLAFPAAAVDLGHVEGTLTIDSTRIPLSYAYAVGRQKNLLTDRKEMTRVILTDKPLPEDAKLTDLDDSLPGDLNGVIIAIDKQGRVGHVAVQHPTGNYDGGYFEGIPDYDFKPKKGDSGTFGGTVTALRVKTNTMTFSFEATFVAALR